MQTRRIDQRASTVFYANASGIVLALLLTAWAACEARAQDPRPQDAQAQDAQAQNDGPHPLVYRPSAKNSQLSLTEKEVRLLELPARIKSVDGFDPTIIRIDTVESFHQVRMLALVPGFTSVVLVDENGRSYTIDILVNGDVKQFQALVRQAAP